MASTSTSSHEDITFKQGTIQRLLQKNFKEEKTKINKDALVLIVELSRIFVNEGACRSAQQAKSEQAMVVEPRHLEKVLPQLLLDF
ncbi:centromere protein X [Strongylocentrotus purpuratus]|uniref:Centromere protein X n=1 Tax=Strongylocentrotus purpuratus TaxID=7668 RepID=A0A7M7GRC0_STRPU|nr:centromere protein X [Strongylocentrotus purpuratus]